MACRAVHATGRRLLPMFVYVGTYTGPGQGEGIYVYRLDPSSGALTHVQTVSEVDNPLVPDAAPTTAPAVRRQRVRAWRSAHRRVTSPRSPLIA